MPHELKGQPFTMYVIEEAEMTDTQKGVRMNIDNMTLGEAKEISRIFGGVALKKTPFKIGTAYLIRTVTHYWTGRVVEVVGDFLCLEDAAWIADTGRYHECLQKCEAHEVEPVGSAIVGLGAIVDAVKWDGDLPLEAK